MAEPGLDVHACLARVRENDADAARALVEHLYPLVIRIVRTRLPRRLDEEDLAQEIFMRMFHHLDSYLGQVPFEHWVSRIAVNACLNQLRAEKARPELRWADLSEEQADALSATMTADDDRPLDRIATRELVGKLLDGLGPEDRLVIVMMELEDLSLEEIRQRTGWSSVKIRVRAFRARRKLRKQLQRLLPEQHV